AGPSAARRRRVRLGRGLGCAVGRFGRGGAVTRQVALPVAVLLEVGLVPAAAGQAERRCGHLPTDLAAGVAGRAGLRVGVGKLLQTIESVAAGGALERIDGHGSHTTGKTAALMGAAAFHFKAAAQGEDAAWPSNRCSSARAAVSA